MTQGRGNTSFGPFTIYQSPKFCMKQSSEIYVFSNRNYSLKKPQLIWYSSFTSSEHLETVFLACLQLRLAYLQCCPGNFPGTLRFRKQNVLVPFKQNFLFVQKMFPSSSVVWLDFGRCCCNTWISQGIGIVHLCLTV